MVFYRLAATVLLINAIRCDSLDNYVQRDLQSDDNLKLGDFIFEEYGTPGSWTIAQLGSDEMHFGGVMANVMVGLITKAGVPIGNLDEGISTADGIMGLCPGNFALSPSDNDNTDVISTLVKDEVISEHVLTVCLNKDPDGPEGAGKLYLGPSRDQHIMNEFLINREHNNYGYAIDIPKGVLSVPMKLGEKLLTTMETVDWENFKPIVDSGTGGLALPFESVSDMAASFSKVLNPILSQDCKHCNLTTTAFFNLANPQTKNGKGIEGLCAECILKKMPNLSVHIGNNPLEVMGHTFLFKKKSCADTYFIAWYPSPHFIFGTAFMMGKTVQFDVKRWTFRVLEHSVGCTDDHSENVLGNHPIQLSGTKSQILSPLIGVITAEVELGTPRIGTQQQKFVVQMDTGSQDLLLNMDGCGLYSPTNYKDPNPNNNRASQYLQNITEYLSTKQPTSTCGYTREECNIGHNFHFQYSTTFEPKNFSNITFPSKKASHTKTLDCYACKNAKSGKNGKKDKHAKKVKKVKKVKKDGKETKKD